MYFSFHKEEPADRPDTNALGRTCLVVSTGRLKGEGNTYCFITVLSNVANAPLRFLWCAFLPLERPFIEPLQINFFVTSAVESEPRTTHVKRIVKYGRVRSSAAFGSTLHLCRYWVPER